MADGEKYTILSRKQLSGENLDYIIKIVRGAGLSWIGDLKNVLDRDPEGNFVYTLICTRLTPQNRTALQQHGLELKFLQIN